MFYISFKRDENYINTFPYFLVTCTWGYKNFDDAVDRSNNFCKSA